MKCLHGRQISLPSSSQQGTSFGGGFFPFSNNRIRCRECDSWAVKNSRSAGCVIETKKTEMDPKGKITQKLDPGRTISSVYLLSKEKEGKSGQVKIKHQN